MNPYSGLLDLFEKQGLLVKEGNRLAYTSQDNEVIKQFRKAWETNENNCLDKIMSEFDKKQTNKISNQMTAEADIE
jgi:hypothetical protein